MEVKQGAPAPTPAPQAETQSAPKAEAQPQTQEQQPQQAPKKDDEFAHRFAVLSRKQKEVFEQQRALQAKLKEIQEKEELYGLLDKDPAKFFEKKGLSTDELLRKLAGEEQPVENKVDQLMKRIEEYEKREREKEEQEKKSREEETYNKQVAEFKSQLKIEIDADKDRWEAIVSSDSYEDVFEVCRLYYETHGEIPPIEWAADQVEQELVERARKFAALKKIAPKATTDVAEGALKTDSKEQKTPVPTITNKLAPEPMVPNNNRRLSDEESKREAAKLLRFND